MRFGSRFCEVIFRNNTERYYYVVYKEFKMSSKLTKCRRKQKDAPRVVTPKNRSECERKIIKRVDTWVGDAVERERRNEVVFNQSRNKGDITVGTCGVSTSAVYRIRAGNSEDKGNVVKLNLMTLIKEDFRE